LNFVLDTMIVFRRQWRLSMRSPVWVVIGVFQPVLYLALFGPLLTKLPPGVLGGQIGAVGSGTAAAYRFFVPGLLIQLGLSGSTFVGFSVIADYRAGVIERFRVTPVSRLAIMAGRVLRDVITLLVQAIILVLVGMAFGLRAPLLAIVISLGFIILVAVGLASISYATALVIKREESFAPLLNMFIFPLTLLSGVMLPMSLGPTWLQDVSKASPFRYIINAMREAFQGHYANSTMYEGIGVAVGMMVICLFFGSRAFLRENA